MQSAWLLETGGETNVLGYADDAEENPDFFRVIRG
jgi:hypothetical protein